MIAQRDAAIVSSRAGTTRDVIEVHLDLGGYPVILADTAGLRETDDEIEDEGIARALKWAQTADIKLLLFDSTCLPDAATLALIDENALIVLNKADMAENGPINLQGYRLSALTGEGMTALLARIEEMVSARFGTLSRPAPTRERHRTGIREALAALHRFPDAPGIDLAAEDLRIALRSLGRITGRVDVEDLLDIIFRDFCIGK